MRLPPKWMVCFMENPMKMDENWGYPHDLGNLHIILLVISPSYSQSIPIHCLLWVHLNPKWTNSPCSKHGICAVVILPSPLYGGGPQFHPLAISSRVKSDTALMSVMSKKKSPSFVKSPAAKTEKKRPHLWLLPRRPGNSTWRCLEITQITLFNSRWPVSTQNVDTHIGNVGLQLG